MLVIFLDPGVCATTWGACQFLRYPWRQRALTYWPDLVIPQIFVKCILCCILSALGPRRKLSKSRHGLCPHAAQSLVGEIDINQVITKMCVTVNYDTCAKKKKKHVILWRYYTGTLDLAWNMVKSKLSAEGETCMCEGHVAEVTMVYLRNHKSTRVAGTHRKVGG